MEELFTPRDRSLRGKVKTWLNGQFPEAGLSNPVKLTLLLLALLRVLLVRVLVRHRSSPHVSWLGRENRQAPALFPLNPNSAPDRRKGLP